ncbi:MAG TPA: KH domain-containing protein [Chloroflexi bacterium]|nr:MAG: RNA-binding protein [Anaerolineaceae bacterium 4572_5.1]HEY84475.1 KH domain-containing protein [Chloroflexota bacterium]
MKNLIEYIAKSVVDDPDGVKVREKRYGREVVLTLDVAQGDMGRVIGKRGRMANAMRSLLRVSAVKSGKQVSLEIGD